MTIPTFSSLRRLVADAADPLDHPTKGRGAKYGKVVYIDGGHVGARINGRYLIAEGDDHQDSVLALAHKLGATPLDPHVPIVELDREEFRLRITGG